MALEGSRPGGRSARIQRSIHDAVRAVEREGPRDLLTVPRIAERAGVAATTIYRRWGDLDTLLADVAAERFRDAPMPEETGSLVGDLRSYSVQFLEEMSSDPGRECLLDLLRGNPAETDTMACSDRARVVIGEIVARHHAAVEIDEALDRVIAPILFHILFSREVPDPAYAIGLVDDLLEGGPDHADSSRSSALPEI